ncbi:hydroxyacid dehydrogenase [Canicola haemoglobinophilus]|uniref:DNA binding protein n=1 Tax=Canicola haemoglobinophilus TaxID=733 RepID=A0A1V4B2D2_9PAST|nr:virulence RhuM family protein [Canicola haemoglobinophilus]OOS01421.1 hydroxyacid dehydrogenase [Canicola haemoglobinophilus]STO59868.1 DNA binding protein [Canicola haemoglobinophilus]
MTDLIIYNTEDGKSNVALLVSNGEAWLTQNQLAELFDTSVANIVTHIKNILQDNELDENSVVKDYLITAKDGKNYQVKHYSLAMILAIGFRVRSVRGVQFRKWANTTLQTYLEKGFLIDSDRLKNPQGRLDYFDELLEQIREIRASEMRFYQKVRELFSLSSDYDKSDKATQMFFAETQNKLIYAITQQTAAELIVKRAKSSLPNMGLTSWKGKVVRKGDVVVAKNYLNNDELDSLNRLVMIFLESAELRVKKQKDLTLAFWRNNVDSLLEFNGFPVLEGLGDYSHKQMEQLAHQEYEQFNYSRKQLKQMLADAEDLKELERLEISLKNNS